MRRLPAHRSANNTPEHCRPNSLTAGPAAPATHEHRQQFEADERGVWVSDSLGGKVWRLDARTDQLVTSTPAGRGVRDLATGAGGVWVSSPLDGRILRLDAKTGEQVAGVNVGESVAGLAVGDGRVWVAVP